MTTRLSQRCSSPAILIGIACVGACLMFAVLCAPLFTGRVYIEDDLSAFNLPMRHFYQRCLMNGDSPVWMPDMFCGSYAHGEGQAGMFHPEHYLLYRFLPLQAAFNLELLINYPIMLLGAYLFLRRLRIVPYAAVFSSVLLTFCGFFMTNYIHIMIPSTVAYTPWLLILVDIAMHTAHRRVRAASVLGVILLTTLQFLLGFPQCVIISSLIEGLYVLYVLTARRNYTAACALGVAKALSVLLAAPQILPQLDAAYHSIRLAPRFEFVMGGSMHPMNLLQFFSPYLFNRHGWTNDLSQYWDPPYFSAVAPVLLVWVLLRFRERVDTRRIAIACLLLGALGLILALGKYGYLYRLVVYLPVLGKIRNPSRHMLLFHLALAVLIALAVSDLLERIGRGEKTPWRRLCPLFAPFAVSLATAIGVACLRFNLRSDALIAIEKHFAPAQNIWTGPILLAAATAFVLAAARGHRIAIPALILFVLADVSLYSLRHKPSADYDAFIAGIAVPERCDGYRIDPDYRPVWAYTGPTMKGYRVVHGYAALNPTNRLDYHTQIPALRLAGVKWRKTRIGGPPELAVAYEKGIPWLEVPGPMPRARMISNAILCDDPHRDVEKIDIATTALVETPLSLKGPPGTVAPEPTVDRPGEIRWDVHSNGEQLFLLADRYHAGWKADIDGTPTLVLRVNGDFMGCLIPQGGHQVHLKFAPADLKRGINLTLAGIALTVLFYLALNAPPGYRLRKRE